MELRLLEYFLAVAREQSISGAAEALHVTQPTLSRQLRELEDSLGKQLFIRGSRRITLTEDGMLLRKRAEEIVELVRKTENEISAENAVISGDVCIGAAESDAMHHVARTAQILRRSHPGVRLHIVSGDPVDMLERVERGIIDFCILTGRADKEKYDCITLPITDKGGILMRRDSALAAKETVTYRDLKGLPLIIPRRLMDSATSKLWGISDPSALNIAATYDQLYNASLMVEEGVGYALCPDRLINTAGESSLCFRPLDPPVNISIHLIRKKYQIFSAPSEVFLSCFREHIQGLG